MSAIKRFKIKTYKWHLARNRILEILIVFISLSQKRY